MPKSWIIVDPMNPHGSILTDGRFSTSSRANLGHDRLDAHPPHVTGRGLKASETMGKAWVGWILGAMFLCGCSSEDDDSDRVPKSPIGPEDLSPADPVTCAETEDWDPAFAQLEEDVLSAVNAERVSGASCGDERFKPTHPLVMDPALQCAARLHSRDMAERAFFSHDNPSNEDPWERIDAAGFKGFAGGENIAAGRGSGQDTVDQWMESPGHCSNIMNPDFTLIGVGYYPGGEYQHLWTQTFGRTND